MLQVLLLFRLFVCGFIAQSYAARQPYIIAVTGAAGGAAQVVQFNPANVTDAQGPTAPFPLPVNASLAASLDASGHRCT